MTTPRHHSQTRSFLATVAVAIPAMLIGSGLSVPSAQAGYVVTLEQLGANVVATGSGTLDLTDLSFFTSSTASAGIIPARAEIFTGQPDFEPISFYTGFAGPTSLGSRTDAIVPSSGSGDRVGIDPLPNILGVPPGYVSGTSLSDSSTYDSMTFSTIGVTPGTYKWTWGTGADADSFTLQIGPTAPTVNTMPIAYGCTITLACVGTQYAYSFSDLSGTGDVFVPIVDQLGVLTFRGVSGLADATLITNPATITADWPGTGNVIPPSKSIFDDPAGLLEVPENGSMTLSFSFNDVGAPVNGPILADSNLLDPLVPGPAAVLEPSTISLLVMALVWMGLVGWKGMPR